MSMAAVKVPNAVCDSRFAQDGRWLIGDGGATFDLEASNKALYGGGGSRKKRRWMIAKRQKIGALCYL